MTSRLAFAAAIFGLLLAFAASVAAQSSRRIEDDHRFGCKSEEYFDRLTDYAVARDHEAFKQGLTAGILLGECTLFEKGQEVFIMDTKILSGLVKIRRKGELKEYWTNIETVRR